MKRKFKTLKPLVQEAGIYIISCTKTNKVYIGETLNISARIVKHFSRLRKNKHSNAILQNIFNKYKEENFIVDILKYSNFDDTLTKEDKIKILRKDEEYYQKLYSKNCISLDKNEVAWSNNASDYQIEQNKKQLDSIRGAAIKACQVNLIIYDIETDRKIEVDSISEAKKYIEQKHLYRNIHDKVYLPYKGRYVAFIPEEFDINKILKTNCSENAVCSTVCSLYNLKTGEINNFTSKTQFSLYFSNSRNDKLYDKYCTFIDDNFLTAKQICSINDFWNSDIVFWKTSRSMNTCNLHDYFNALNTYTTNIEFAKKLGINRHTVTEMLKYKSIKVRLLEINSILGHLPNLFKNWKPSSI